MAAGMRGYNSWCPWQRSRVGTLGPGPTRTTTASATPGSRTIRLKESQKQSETESRTQNPYVEHRIAVTFRESFRATPGLNSSSDRSDVDIDGETSASHPCCE